MDAQLDKTGTEPHVFHATVEDNGTLPQSNAFVLPATGTDSHAFNALPDKPGTLQAFHAHAHQQPTGTVFLV